jgi:hypothetical protein
MEWNTLALCVIVFALLDWQELRASHTWKVRYLGGEIGDEHIDGYLGAWYMELVDSLDSYWQIPFVECHRAALFISVCCDENTGL